MSRGITDGCRIGEGSAGTGSGGGPRRRRGATRRLGLVTGRPLTDRRGAYFTGTAELSDNSDTSSSSTMLSRVSTRSGKALSRSALRSVAFKDVRRSFVQPSGADRASVVDVPSSYQEDTAFAPRVGELAGRYRTVLGMLIRTRRHVWLQTRGNPPRRRRL